MAQANASWRRGRGLRRHGMPSQADHAWPFPGRYRVSRSQEPRQVRPRLRLLGLSTPTAVVPGVRESRTAFGTSGWSRRTPHPPPSRSGRGLSIASVSAPRMAPGWTGTSGTWARAGLRPRPPPRAALHGDRRSRVRPRGADPGADGARRPRRATGIGQDQFRSGTDRAAADRCRIRGPAPTNCARKAQQPSTTSWDADDGSHPPKPPAAFPSAD